MKISINTKLNVFFAVVSLLSTLSVALVSDHYMQGFIQSSQKDALLAKYDYFISMIDSQSMQAEMLASSLSAIPTVAAALGMGDRDGLLKLTESVFTVMKKEYAADQLQFHTPPATSFLRVNSPSKFGDDLSSFRFTVVGTNKNQKPMRGIEAGVTVLSIRGVAPVLDGGKHVGSVEFGFGLAQPFVDSFKKLTSVDLALYTNNKGKFSPIAKTMPDALLTPEAMGKALEGEDVITETDYNGHAVAVMGKAIKDFSGTSFGVVEVVMNAEPYAAQKLQARQTIMMFGGIVLLLSVLVGYLMSRSITRPVVRLSDMVKRISDGEFDFDVDYQDRKDEIGTLAHGIQNVKEVSQNCKQVDEKQGQLFEKIRSEREKLDDGMRDQLHGIVEVSIISNNAYIVLTRVIYFVGRAVHEIQSMAAAIEEMVASTNTIASSSETAAFEAGEAESEAREGVKAATQARDVNGALNEAVTEVGGRIHDLDTATTQIGEIINQIEAIAAQTNLLALNATIEAARAGEAGKGFAVVAGEVKSLASQTGRATDDIRSRIDVLRKEMEAAIKAMDDSKKAVSDGTGAVDRVTTQLGSISSRIDGVTQRMREIAGILAQQTQASTEISGSSTRIATLSQTNYRDLETALDILIKSGQTLDARVEKMAENKDPRTLIEVAKSDHVRFRRSIVERLAGRNDLTPDKISTHLTCRLGQWYHNVTDPEILGCSAYKNLLPVHQMVHEEGRKVLELCVLGKFDEAFEEMTKVDESSEKVIEALTELGRRLNERSCKEE